MEDILLNPEAGFEKFELQLWPRNGPALPSLPPPYRFIFG
jgi:hypothetical protein